MPYIDKIKIGSTTYNIKDATYSLTNLIDADSSKLTSITTPYNSTVTSNYSFAEGQDNSITSAYGHAEGSNNTISATASHAEGAYTTASGYYSHAEGYHTTASGNYSHAEGYYSTANSSGSHASGYYTTTANTYYSYVTGLYNRTTSNLAGKFTVGNGTSDTNRSDAFKVYNTGKLVGAGGILGNVHSVYLSEAVTVGTTAKSVLSWGLFSPGIYIVICRVRVSNAANTYVRANLSTSNGSSAIHVQAASTTGSTTTQLNFASIVDLYDETAYRGGTYTNTTLYLNVQTGASRTVPVDGTEMHIIQVA